MNKTITRRRSTLKLFTAPQCPDCDVVERLLAKSELAYEAHDTSTDQGLAEAMLHGVSSTPTVLIVGIDSGEKLLLHRAVGKNEIEDMLEWLSADERESERDVEDVEKASEEEFHLATGFGPDNVGRPFM